jgi:hypothetical protein
LPPVDPLEFEVQKTRRVERARLPYVLLALVVAAIMAGIVRWTCERTEAPVRSRASEGATRVDTTAKNPVRTTAVRGDTSVVP